MKLFDAQMQAGARGRGQGFFDDVAWKFANVISIGMLEKGEMYIFIYKEINARSVGDCRFEIVDLLTLYFMSKHYGPPDPLEMLDFIRTPVIC